MMCAECREITYHCFNFILERVIENLGRKYEKVLDILAGLGRRLKMEHDAAVFLELLDAIEGHLALLLHIFLIANKE